MKPVTKDELNESVTPTHQFMLSGVDKYGNRLKIPLDFKSDWIRTPVFNGAIGEWDKVARRWVHIENIKARTVFKVFDSNKRKCPKCGRVVNRSGRNYPRHQTNIGSYPAKWCENSYKPI